ncbi:hypothetical protein RB195_024268 [Necator americanus]|uniref:Uncharacterized protein n=1 Tax=Necator americanus TaxID=51031 RepID=A0ABR1EPU9_NECAM
MLFANSPHRTRCPALSIVATLMRRISDSCVARLQQPDSKPITFTQETKYLIRKPRAVSDVAFESDHTPVLLSLITWFQKGSRGVSYQPKLNMARLKDVEYRMKFGQLTSIDIDSTAEMEER